MKKTSLRKRRGLAVFFCLAVMGCLAAGCRATGQGGLSLGAEPFDVAAADTKPALVSTAVTGNEPERQPFHVWLENLRFEALQVGLSPRTLDRALAAIRVLDKVQELDRRQPEFSRAIWSYLDAVVSDKRVADGRRKLVEQSALLGLVQARSGVPATILVAFWAIESDFGQITGNFNVLDALATLAWRSRRTDFFRAELLDALRILERGEMSVERMVGSWAGAMGQTQFMPSAYLRYAVDGDGDGKRDIWTSVPDVVWSIAQFVAANGWRRGESWGEEVRLPEDFAYELADLSIGRPLAFWRKMGVQGVGEDGSVGRGGMGKEESTSILVPAGRRGPAFLVGQNFRVLLRYNPALSYALAVALLSDRLQGGGQVKASWPREEPVLSRAEIVELQQRLNALGFESGLADGAIGPGTRGAVRAFQGSVGLKADGFATRALLERLRP